MNLITYYCRVVCIHTYVRMYVPTKYYTKWEIKVILCEPIRAQRHIDYFGIITLKILYFQLFTLIIMYIKRLYHYEDCIYIYKRFSVFIILL